MGAFRMMGELLLNATHWQAGLSKAGAQAAQFSDKVQHDFSKKIGKSFGYGLLAGAFFTPFQKFADALTGGFDRAKEIQDNANKLKITAEEYQMVEAAAKDAGQGVDEFINAIRKHGNIGDAIAQLERYRNQVNLTNEEVQDMADAEGGFWGRLKKTGTKFDAWAYGGLINFLTRESLDGEMTSKEITKAIAADDAARRANNKAEAKAKGLGFESLFKDKPDQFQVNEWQRIGEFVGGGGTAAKLDKVIENTAKTAAAAERTAKAVEGGGPGPMNHVAGSMFGGGMGTDWR